VHGRALFENGAAADEADAGDQAFDHFRLPSGECTSRFSLAWTKPQLASATSGKVRNPALRAFSGAVSLIYRLNARRRGAAETVQTETLAGRRNSSRLAACREAFKMIARLQPL
jgi:hypothetical protein